MKFKFNYLHQTLSYQNPWESETWTEITETFEGNFGSLGFKLTEGWINFSLKPHKIQAFLKYRKFNNYLEAFSPKESAKYFKKDLPKEEEEIIFTFEPQDEVEKIGNNWVKKGGLHD